MPVEGRERFRRAWRAKRWYTPINRSARANHSPPPPLPPDGRERRDRNNARFARQRLLSTAKVSSLKHIVSCIIYESIRVRFARIARARERERERRLRGREEGRGKKGREAKRGGGALTEEKHISLLLLPPSLFFLPTDLDSRWLPRLLPPPRSFHLSPALPSSLLPLPLFISSPS